MGRGGPAPYGGPPPAGFTGRGIAAAPGPYPQVGRFEGGRGGGGGRGFSGGRGMSNGHSGGERRGGGGRGFDSGRGGFRGGGRGGRHGGGGHRDDLDKVSLPKQDFGNLVPFEKNFYVESPSVRAMTEPELRMYRARREITVEGHDVPRPIRMFHEANFPGSSWLILLLLSVLIITYLLL